MTRKTSPNPDNALTPEKYAAMLRHFLDVPAPTIESICQETGVGRIMAKRALTIGWPEINLPPLPNAFKQLIDPIEVHKQMAKLQDERKAIVDNLFGPAVSTDLAKPLPKPATDEATKRAAESGMAARVAASVAVKSATAVEKLAEKFLEMIDRDEFELPEKVRPEHILLLVKAADAAQGAVHKALQIERLRNGDPSEMVGAHIVNLLVGANSDEMREIAMTGKIPNRLLGIITPPKAIDAKIIESVDVTSEEVPEE